MKITTAWEMGKGGPELMGMWGGDAEGTHHMVQVLMRRGAPVRELVLNVPDSAIESLFATPEVEATPDTARSPDGFDPSAAFDCALCLYAPEGRMVEPAVTVIEGYAVCYDHMGYVAQGQRFAALRSALGEGS